MKKSKRIRRCRIPRKNRGNKISPVGICMTPLDLALRIAEKGELSVRVAKELQVQNRSSRSQRSEYFQRKPPN